MVSTKTQIAGFEFDNCLMNAAGVACLTIEEVRRGQKLSGRNLCY
ncbi:dihydroorotate dehydrogenase [Streptococcus pneumoniae]|nr:dihydroorotate dehydrogenase [Streptococcus pneumoniae]